MFDIKKIAHLARIAVCDEEAKIIEQKLTNIMSMLDTLQKVDTTNIEPFVNPLRQFQRLRADEVTAKNEREKFQALAPAVADHLYLVPEVIE